MEYEPKIPKCRTAKKPFNRSTWPLELVKGVSKNLAQYGIEFGAVNPGTCPFEN